MTLEVLAPVPGKVVPLVEVPDPVFSQETVGPGIAIDPPAGPADGEVTAVAPVAGTVVKVQGHAYVIQTAEGKAVLVHLGLNTVELAGEGFEVHVAVGAEVAAGDPIITWDPNDVEASGRHAICPVIALEAPASALEILVGVGDEITAGVPLVRWS